MRRRIPINENISSFLFLTINDESLLFINNKKIFHDKTIPVFIS